MVSETEVSPSDDGNAVNRSSVSNRKKRGKVPRKIIKAEREKSKRDHMNVLFLQLEKVIEPALQNKGKASILNNTIRFLGDLFTQIDSLKEENASLLSETQYVTIEKNELKEEKSALETKIEKLKSEIEERIQSQSSWNSGLSVSQPTAQTLPEDHLRLPSINPISHSAPLISPFVVLALHHDSQAYTKPDTAEVVPPVQSNVSRPRPRYPSQSDSWSSNILAGQANLTEGAKQGCIDASSVTTTSVSD